MDLQRFLDASFSNREETIEVPELAPWFPEGQAKWTIRAITAREVAKAKTVSESGQEAMRDLATALAQGGGEKVEAIQRLIGVVDKGSDPDFVYRLELLCAGSVEPSIKDKREVAVMLSEKFPTVFYKLTSQILILTGMGAEIAKSKPSGSPESSNP